MSVSDSFKLSMKSLREASPLEIPQILENIELYDRETAEDLLNRVYSDFQKEDLIDNVVTPVLTSIIDGVFRHPRFKGVVQKVGLSSTLVMQECKSFNYDSDIVSLMPDAFVEQYNQTKAGELWGKDNRNKYIRSQYENTYKINEYKNMKGAENSGKKNMLDEYRSTKDITAKKNNADNRRNDPKNLYNAETDHIVPLRRIFSQVQNNSGLSDDDIKRIANSESNFAVTGRLINNPKRDMSNSEFIAAQDKLKAEGKPYVELSPEVRVNMIQMEKDAQASINSGINQKVIDNLLGKGKAEKEERKKAIEQKQAEYGRKKLTKEELSKIDVALGRQKAFDIHKINVNHAKEQTLHDALGSAILFIIKPLYYELKDGICNGFKEGVCANTYGEAFKIRFSRIKNYVWKQLSSLKSYFSSSMKMLKNFLSSLIEGLLGMFVGIFKKIFKVLKEGVKVFVQAWPILFGEQSKKMSASQKGDAIIKLLGGSIVALCGIGLDMLLEKLAFIPEDFRGVAATMLSGLASVLLFYALDKADLFNVKEEERRNRVHEIFNERINDIKEVTSTMTENVAEVLKQQKIELMNLMHSFDDAVIRNDYDMLNKVLIKQASFLGVNLPYSDLESFKQVENNINWNM